MLSTPGSWDGRPETEVPNSTSSLPVIWESSSPHAPCTAVLSVMPWSTQDAESAPVSAAPSSWVRWAWCSAVGPVTPSAT